MDGSRPALPAEPGTLNASLAATPAIEKMTEKEPAHPDPMTLQELSAVAEQFSKGEEGSSDAGAGLPVTASKTNMSPPCSPTQSQQSFSSDASCAPRRTRTSSSGHSTQWVPTTQWVQSWKQKLPLQTIMRLLQVLVPQVEKICIDKGLTDESEILKFLQHGTLVGLLPVPHPILIRKYQANSGTTLWFHTYMWGIIYLRNIDPPIWYDTDVKLFEIQRV